MTDTINTTDRRDARKPASLVGMEPVTDVESYDSVPWYRKQWFALFPLFAPALILIALTGNVYASATKTMKGYSDVDVWRYTAASRVFFIAVAVFVTVMVTSSIWW